jgi:molecular chaperone DnaK (HSP70)
MHARRSRSARLLFFLSGSTTLRPFNVRHLPRRPVWLRFEPLSFARLIKAISANSLETGQNRLHPITTNSISSKAVSTVNTPATRYALPSYDRSRTSYGILLRTGYFEMIPGNTPLPAHATEIFESAIDDVNRDTFKVASLKSPLDIPRIITEVELREIQVGRKESANVEVNFSINEGEIGRVTVQDTITLSLTSVTFNAGISTNQISPSANQRDPIIEDRDPT